MSMEFPKVDNKLAFFDYDWTLVVHNYSKDYLAAFVDGYLRDCYYMLTKIEEEHAGDKPLPCMQWYVNKLFENGYGIFVITHEMNNLRDELKKRKLKEFYSDIPVTYLTVDCPEHKVDMIEAVALSEGCELSDVIFVDDKMETVNMAKAAGIDAKYLSDIALLYETRYAAWQQGTVLKPKGVEETVKEDSSPKAYDFRATPGFSDEGFNDVFEECRRLAEMNGRNGDSRDGSTQL